MSEGELFKVETIDWTAGQIKDDDSAEDMKKVDLTQVPCSLLQHPLKPKLSEEGRPVTAGLFSSAIAEHPLNPRLMGPMASFPVSGVDRCDALRCFDKFGTSHCTYAVLS